MIKIKNIITLSAGLGIAQLTTFIATPILAKFFTAEDFGIYSAYMAFATIIGGVATGRYELAIIKEGKEDKITELRALSIYISIAMAAAVIMTSLLIQAITKNSEYQSQNINWIHLISLSIIVIAYMNGETQIAIKNQDYRKISIAHISRSLVMVFVQIAGGLLKVGSYGLIIGHILSILVANILLTSWKNKLYIKLKKNKLQVLLTRYINYPKYSAPAMLLNNINSNIFCLYFYLFETLSATGYYAVAQRILGVPATVLGTAIGQIFYREAAEEKKAKGNSIETFNDITIKLITISLLIFAPLYWALPFVMSEVFGDKWQDVAIYGKLILPMTVGQFIIAGISTTVNVFERQNVSFYWQIGAFIISMIAIGLSNLSEMKAEEVLGVYSYTVAAYCLCYYFILRKIAMNMRGK